MKNDDNGQAVTVFLQNLPGAVSKLKNRLQRNYEQAYPHLRNLIRIVLDEEEAAAWNLSPFPHLFLPDLVEARIARLGTQPADTQRNNVQTPHGFSGIEDHQPALAYVDC